jgi:aquaporin NIP
MMPLSIDHPLTIVIGLGFLGVNLVCLLTMLGLRPGSQETLRFSDLLRGGLAEALGTFAWLLVSGLLIVAGHGERWEIALVTGGLLTALILGPGVISGGHFNPAVTVALTVAGRHSFSACVLWLVGQLLGAGLAFALLILGVGQEGLVPLLPVPDAALNPRMVFLLEVVASFVFLLVVSTATLRSSPLVAVASGMTFGVLLLVFGPLTGCGINPARYAATALLLGNFEAGATYLTAPFIGAVVAAALVQCCFVQRPQLHAAEFPEDDSKPTIRHWAA